MARGLSKFSLYNNYLKFKAPKDLMENGCVEHLNVDEIIKRHNFKVVHCEKKNLGMTYVYILQKESEDEKETRVKKENEDKKEIEEIKEKENKKEIEENL